jgi:hypothetical protein
LENIQVDEQAVQSEAVNTINQINQYYKPDEARRMLSQDFIQNMIGSITSDLMVKNTLDKLTSIAKGEVEAQQAAEALPTQETEQAPESVNNETVTEPAAESAAVADINPVDQVKPTKKRKSTKETV